MPWLHRGSCPRRLGPRGARPARWPHRSSRTPQSAAAALTLIQRALSLWAPRPPVPRCLPEPRALPPTPARRPRAASVRHPRPGLCRRWQNGRSARRRRRPPPSVVDRRHERRRGERAPSARALALRPSPQDGPGRAQVRCRQRSLRVASAREPAAPAVRDRQRRGGAERWGLHTARRRPAAVRAARRGPALCSVCRGEPRAPRKRARLRPRFPVRAKGAPCIR